MSPGVPGGNPARREGIIADWGPRMGTRVRGCSSAGGLFCGEGCSPGAGGEGAVAEAMWGGEGPALGVGDVELGQGEGSWGSVLRG